MGIYIKSVNCDCDDCTPDDPCAGGCVCGCDFDFSDSEAGGWTGTKISNPDVTGQFTGSGNCSVGLNVSEDGSIHEISIYADGVLVFHAGPTSSPVATEFDIPAGTTSLEIVFVVTVGGDGPGWDLACNSG